MDIAYRPLCDATFRLEQRHNCLGGINVSHWMTRQSNYSSKLLDNTLHRTNSVRAIRLNNLTN